MPGIGGVIFDDGIGLGEALDAGLQAVVGRLGGEAQRECEDCGRGERIAHSGVVILF